MAYGKYERQRHSAPRATLAPEIGTDDRQDRARYMLDWRMGPTAGKEASTRAARKVVIRCSGNLVPDGLTDNPGLSSGNPKRRHCADKKPQQERHGRPERTPRPFPGQCPHEGKAGEARDLHAGHGPRRGQSVQFEAA